MDTLSQVLSDVRSSGALLGQSLMSPPWAVGFDEGASMTLVSVLRGDGWIRTADAEAEHLNQRDVAIVTGPEPFLVSSEHHADVPPLFIQAENGVCTDASGDVLDVESICLGVRTSGKDLNGEHALLSGTYIAAGRVAQRLLTALPRVLVVPHETGDGAPLQLLEREIVRNAPGQQVVLDRLLDLVLAGTLRDWFALPGSAVPAWYAAAADDVVGPALAAMHGDPARRWSVQELAGRGGVSRATFARRFRAAMGEGPMAYLTGWRLCLASDLLVESDATLESIARRVGYASAFALSSAFTRHYDVRPGEYRRAAQPPPVAGG